LFFKVHHCDISNTGIGDDLYNLQKNNIELTSFNANNQTLHLTSQPQSSILISVPNTNIITANTLVKTHQRTGITGSSNFVGLNDITITQGSS
jgi:hypothetical protein